MILTCCSSVTDHNWKGLNTGGALAVTKGLVRQVEGLVGEYASIVYGKNALAVTVMLKLLFLTCVHKITI